jgi:hypothetical protein
MGSGCIGPCFLYLGTSSRRVVALKSVPLYPRGKNILYSLDKRLGGPQSSSGICGELKIIVSTWDMIFVPSVFQTETCSAI